MEILEQATKFTVLLVGGVASLKFLMAAAALRFRASKLDYDSNRGKAQGFWNTLFGTIPTYKGDNRDPSLSAGFEVDLRTKKVTCNGKLSDESIARIFPERIL